MDLDFVTYFKFDKILASKMPLNHLKPWYFRLWYSSLWYFNMFKQLNYLCSKNDKIILSCTIFFMFSTLLCFVIYSECDISVLKLLSFETFANCLFPNIRFQEKGLDFGFGQNFGLVTQCSGYTSLFLKLDTGIISNRTGTQWLTEGKDCLVLRWTDYF